MSALSASTRLGFSSHVLSPYVEQYWRDCDRDEVYAAAVLGIHVDQAGEVVGQSWHVNGPSADWGESFVSDLMAAADGEVVSCG